jgi:FixJ family two-component response regulator
VIEPNHTSLTVFIVDDDASVRDSIALLLSLRGYRTAIFARAEDFLQALQPHWTGCLLTDLRMQGMSGLELQAELVRRECPLPVVVLTAHGDVSAARAAFKSNAIDFLQKPYDDEDLCAAIDAGLERERLRLRGRADADDRTSRIAELSAREHDVTALLARGLNNREIGAHLGISPRTVEAHKARLMRKLGAGNLAELIRIVDLVDPARR